MIYAVEEDTNKDKAIRRDADTLIHLRNSVVQTKQTLARHE